MPLTIEEMVDRIDLSQSSDQDARSEAIKSLTKLSKIKETREAFAELHNRLEKYPAGKKMNKDEAENTIAEIVKKHIVTSHRFEAAHGACKALSGIGTLVKSRQIEKACSITEQSLTFAEKIKDFSEIIKLPNLDITMLLGPAGAFSALCSAASIAFSLFGGFDESPSIDQLILEQLQAISEQIETLRIEMHEGFVELHEHLDEIQEQIFQSNRKMLSELTSQISGLKSDMASRLDSLCRYLDQNFKQINSNQRHIALQHLRDIVAKITCATDDNTSQNILELETNLVTNWLLSQIGSPIFNGSEVFERGNVETSHELDINILSTADTPDKLASILGYIAHIAAENDRDYPRRFNPQKMLNPLIFDFAVQNLLALYQKYPAQLEQCEDHLKEVREVCQNSLDLFENITERDQIFINLFKNYIEALQEIESAVQLEINRTNLEFHEEHPLASTFDISDSLDTTLNKFKSGPLPEDIKYAKPNQETLNNVEKREDFDSIRTTHSNVNIPALNINNILESSESFPLSSDIIFGSHLGLAEIKASYDFQYGSNFTPVASGTDIANHNPYQDGNGKKYKPDYIVYKIKFDINLPSIRFCFETSAWITITDDYNQRPHLLLNMLAKHPKYPSGFIAYANQEEREAISGLTNKTAIILRLKPEAFQGFILDNNSFKFKQVNASIMSSGILIRTSIAPSQPLVQYTAKLKEMMVNILLDMRKHKVIRPLINNDHPEIKKALNHLDSARYRLIAFCRMANLNESLIAKVQELSQGKNIKDYFNYYLAHAKDLETPMLSLPNHEDIVRLQDDILEELRRIRTIQHTPNAAEKRLLESAIKLETCQTSFLPSYRNSARGRLIRKAKALGFDLIKFDEKTKGNMSPQRINYLALVSILENDVNGIKSHVQDYEDLPLINWYIDDRKSTILHVAAYFGNRDILDAMKPLFKKAMNRKDRDGKTPLIYAVEGNNYAAVEIFISEGADVNITNNSNQNAYELSENCQDARIRQALSREAANRTLSLQA